MEESTYYIVSVTISISGFIGVLATILYLRKQFIAIHANRETELLVKLYEISSQAPLSVDFERIWHIQGDEVLRGGYDESSLRVCLFFEMLGTIVSQKYVRTRIIDEYFGSLVFGCFSRLKPYIDVQRATPMNQRFAINFQRLSESLEQLEMKSPRCCD